MAQWIIDPELKRWATPKQAEYIDAVNEHGSGGKAAIALGVAKNAVNESIRYARKKAAAQGYSPEHGLTHYVPDPYIVKGVSTYRDANGEIKGQWVKTALDKERYEEAIREWLDGLAEGVRGVSVPVDPPAYANADLFALYPMGDPHFGLYAWAEEAGEDFDLEEAERRTCAAMDRLVAAAPPCETALICQLGDFFHAENSRNQTPASGNPLDVDTRFGKVIQVGLRSMVYLIERAKSRHKKVMVWNLPGNHDPHAALMLAMCLSAYYHNDDRVEIDTSPSLYKYFQFGRVLIGSHHGHGAKHADLPLLMAADRPTEWGITTFRYWHLGHFHHDSMKEHPGVSIETHGTLAGSDAWHAMKGYRSRKSMKAIIYHRLYGELERHTCAAAMIEKEAK